MKRQQNRRGIKALSFFLIFGFLFSLAVIPCRAAETAVSETFVSDFQTSHYKTVKIRVGGKTLSGLLIANTTYVPLRAFGEKVLGAKVSYDSRNRQLTLRTPGLILTAADGSYFTEANGRYLYAQTPSLIMSDGRMYIPIRVAAKAVGLSVFWSGSTVTATLYGNVSYIESGSTYYDTDEVYWLSRIISAEAQGEPLLGQVAVGRVVLNRVFSSLYPNTIYGVIFDRRYGVQFTPVANGTIYASPTASSVKAAKIALEGDVCPQAILFFMEPRKSSSRWIANTRRYAYSIGNHDFYY